MVFRSLHRPFWFACCVGLLILTELLVVRSAAFQRQPESLSLAVLFDLMVLPTGLFYWFLARPNGWSPLRTGLVAGLMFRIGLYILPTRSLPLPLDSTAILPLLEGLVLLTAGVRIGAIRRDYHRLRSTLPADQAMQGALTRQFGNRLAGLLVGEWQIVRYAALGWRLPIDLPDNARPLTTHRESGQVALMAALGAVAIVELIAGHLLLSRWNAGVATGLSLLSAYGLLVLLAEVMATVKRPSYLTADTLHLRLGIRWQTTIDRQNIGQVVSLSDKPASRPGLLNAALLTSPNVLLCLREPVTVHGPYGIRREVRWLSLWLDGGVTALA